MINRLSLWNSILWMPSKSWSWKWWSHCGAEHITSITIYAALHSHTHRAHAYLRGGWCLLHWCCLGNRLCKRICSRLWCRAPRRWRAAYCTSCTWSSWGETLCSELSGPSRLERCPANSRRTWCRNACRRERSSGWLRLSKIEFAEIFFCFLFCFVLEAFE